MFGIAFHHEGHEDHGVSNFIPPFVSTSVGGPLTAFVLFVVSSYVFWL
jgi:hypothetical protein